jgi:glyoxylase-like metal-dependent hydrolase (beta-lactamase superfamily II)
LGRFALHEIRDGSFALDGGAMFGVVPRPLWEKQIAPDARNRIPMALRCLLIEDTLSPRKVLVDTGIGEWAGEKQRDIYAIDRSARSLEGDLARAGVARDQITDVIITHLHFDHAGGLARRGAGGEWEPAFPRATVHIQRRHWSWAHHPTARDAGSFIGDTFRLLEGSGRLHLLEGETELFAGVSILVSEGHTVGMQLVRVSDGGQALTHCADLVPTRAHLRVSWGMAYDNYPLTLIEEKRMLLAQAVEENGILYFEHDPQAAACRVREERGEVVMAEQVAL